MSVNYYFEMWMHANDMFLKSKKAVDLNYWYNRKRFWFSVACCAKHCGDPREAIVYR